MMRATWIKSGMSASRRRGEPTARGTVVAVAVLAAALAVTLLVPGAARATDRSHLTSTALEQSMIVQINALRAAHDLGPLTANPALFESASLHCRQMLAGGYFGHQAPDGRNFGVRLEAFYPPRGFGYYEVGENLFWTVRAASSSRIVEAWMASPSHRANLLSADWRQVGIAAVQAPSAPGVYDGRGVTVVTVDFGVRR
jgi:uncharacterized protein YkwD